MRVPLADVTELVQRGFDGAAHGGFETDDSALEPFRAAPTVLGLGQGMRDVDGLTAHVGNAEKDAAGFPRQAAGPQAREFGEKIAIVGDRPLAKIYVMHSGAALLNEVHRARRAELPDTHSGIIAIQSLGEPARPGR